MSNNRPVTNGRWQVAGNYAPAFNPAACHSPLAPHRAFSLIEVLVVVSLLAFIVLALMAVFSSTQRAFRAAVTQTDVMEGSRATMELMAADLRGATPSDNGGATNFLVLGNSVYDSTYLPLPQTLPGAVDGSGNPIQRTNQLNYFFVLGRNNTTWTGTGYLVDTAHASPLYGLYRFYAETNVMFPPQTLFQQFQAAMSSPAANMSHLIDGVVHLNVRAYDPNGVWINGYTWPYTNGNNTFFFPPSYGETQFYMVGNMVPAAVEVELGVVEDRILQRAESRPPALQAQYLSDKSGSVHLFRQRVTIPNVDPTAYQ